VKTVAVSNQEIAEVFDEMAGLLEARGDSVFKVRAYQGAAAVAGRGRVSRGDELKGIPGVGEAIRGKIHEYITTGRVSALEKLRYGVAMARRGRCEPKHILNTLPLDDFMAFIKTPKPERMRVFARRWG